MHFNVAKKGEPTRVSGRGAEGDEEQQRQPREQGDNEQPAINAV